MCTVINIIFYCLIFLSFITGAISWVALQKYAAAVAKNSGLEKDFFYSKAADDSGASIFEVKMLKEVMSNQYLSRSEELVNLGGKARLTMLIALGSGVTTVIAAAFRHVICGL
jgi:hypothetical protein